MNIQFWLFYTWEKVCTSCFTVLELLAAAVGVLVETLLKVNPLKKKHFVDQTETTAIEITFKNLVIINFKGIIESIKFWD